MSWPDDNQPRYTIDTNPTIRVLDRAYNHRVVREWSNCTHRTIGHAEAFADKLNQADEETDE